MCWYFVLYDTQYTYYIQYTSIYKINPESTFACSFYTPQPQDLLFNYCKCHLNFHTFNTSVKSRADILIYMIHNTDIICSTHRSVSQNYSSYNSNFKFTSFYISPIFLFQIQNHWLMFSLSSSLKFCHVYVSNHIVYKFNAYVLYFWCS